MKSSIFWDISQYKFVEVNWPHGIIFQKIKLFKPTNMRTSNPTVFYHILLIQKLIES
jgi:hypothetical protein